MKQLTVSPSTFTEILSGLIQSGVTFDAVEDKKGEIVITFTGGY
jgi:hypothetical protein